MDFNRKQYDSLSLGYYRGVISHKEILYEQDQYRVNLGNVLEAKCHL